MSAMGPLRPHPINPRYFADPSGRPVYLSGSHTWANFATDQGTSSFDYPGYLAALERHGHNFFRAWVWDLPWSRQGYNGGPFRFGPSAWLRTGPGTATDGEPRFDLTAWNDAYFERIRTRTSSPVTAACMSRSCCSRVTAGNSTARTTMASRMTDATTSTGWTADPDRRIDPGSPRCRGGPGGVRASGRRHGRRPGQRAVRDRQRGGPVLHRLAGPSHPPSPGIRTRTRHVAPGRHDLPVRRWHARSPPGQPGRLDLTRLRCRDARRSAGRRRPPGDRL